MNYVEKIIFYTSYCYLNVNCVLNIEQNVNIIPARIFVEKYIAYMVFISFYRLEGILKPSMILNFINDKIYTKKRLKKSAAIDQ